MQILFQLRKVVFDVVEYEVIAVDDVVDEGIGEVIGAFFAQSTDAFAAAVADKGEGIVGVFLKGEYKPFTDKERDLFGDEFEVVVVEPEVGQGEEQTVVVFVEFGALSGIEYVFECQGVDAEFVADFFNKEGIGQSTDIDPPNEVFVLDEESLVVVLNFFVIAFVVSNGKYMCGVSFPIAGVNEGAGRKSSFAQLGFMFFLAHGANISPSGSETKIRLLRKTIISMLLRIKFGCSTHSCCSLRKIP